MCSMSKASEISNNVFLGPTPDPVLNPDCVDEDAYDMLIEATDLAHVPESRSLRALKMGLEKKSRKYALHMEFPSSGSIMPPSWSHSEIDGLMDMCKWMFELANPHDQKKTKLLSWTTLQHHGNSYFIVPTVIPRQHFSH
jgi:dual specificity MAP kinase phosphatase